MLENGHDKILAFGVILGREHWHERFNIGRTGGKVRGGCTADKSAVRVRTSVLVADLGLLLLLETSASLDLALF